MFLDDTTRSVFGNKLLLISPFAVLCTLGLLNPNLAGAFVGVLVTSLKAGAGCRFGNVKEKVVAGIAATYFSIAVLLSLVLDWIVGGVYEVLKYSLLYHAAVALLMLYVGYLTLRENARCCDVSSKTFLVLSAPCPVCLTATLISCYFTAEAFGISKIFAGILTGLFTAFGIITFSLTGKKRNPEKLGEIMIMLGIFYVFSILLIPAFIQSMKVSFQLSITLSPYSLLLLLPLALGIVKGWFRC